jgi:hypothetical protein
MTRYLTLATLAATACVDFDDVPRNVCGNGVVEGAAAVLGGAIEPDMTISSATYEECDGGEGCGAPGAANACRWICDASSSCPAGMVCGLDQRCRAPAGTLLELGVLPMATDVLRVADLDGDDLDDLAVGDAGHAALYYGDRALPFEVAATVALPQDSSAVGLLQEHFLSGDGRHAQHLLIGSLGSVTLYAGGSARTYEGTSQITADFGPEVLESFDGVCAAIDLGEVAGVPDPAGNQELLGVLVADGQFLGLTDGDGACVDYTPDDDTDNDECLVGDLAFASAVVESGIISGRLSSLATSDVVVAPVAGMTTLKVFDVVGTGADATPRLRHTLALPADQFLMLDALVAIGDTPFDADHCPDVLVVSDRGHDARPRVSATFGQAIGDVCVGLPAGDPRTPLAPDVEDLFLPAADEFGDVDFTVLGVTDHEGDGQLELLGRTDAGSLFLLGDDFTLIGQIDPNAFLAVGLDHNRDGLRDYVVASYTSTLEVFINTGDGGYSRRAVDVGGIPARLRIGDLDGDRAEDLVVRLAGESQDEVLVGWGDPGGQPTVVASVGEFPSPSLIEVSRRPGLDEVRVYGNPTIDGTCSRPVSLLRGDASRHLSSPVQLVTQDETSVAPQRIVDVSDDERSRAIVFGQQLGGGERQLVALRVDEDGGKVSVWPFTDTQAPIVGMSGTFELSSGVATGAVFGNARPDAVVYATNCCDEPGPACAGDGACLIAADGAAEAPEELAVSMVPVVVAPWERPRLSLRDVDLDGDDDALMAIYDDQDGYRLWVGENDGGHFTTLAGGTIALPTGCNEVTIGAPTEVAGEFGLIASCFESFDELSYDAYLVRATLDVSAGELRDAVRWEGLAGSPYRPHVGDFNGDRIDDLALTMYDNALATTVTRLFLGCALNDEATDRCLAPTDL